MLIELWAHGKASALGIATGAVAGLVAITPASGTAGPLGAIALGAISSLLCYYFATTVKHKFGYDDSLDVFGVHGIGGIIGAILTGVFAAEQFGGAGMELEMAWIRSGLKQRVCSSRSSGVVSFQLLLLSLSTNLSACEYLLRRNRWVLT